MITILPGSSVFVAATSLRSLSRRLSSFSIPSSLRGENSRLLTALDLTTIYGGVNVLGSELPGVAVVGVHRRVVDYVRPSWLYREVAHDVSLYFGVDWIS